MKLIVLSALLTLGLGTAATAASLTLDADTPETGANLQNSDLVKALDTQSFTQTDQPFRTSSHRPAQDR